MYKQVSKDNYNFKILGFKLFENKYEYINIYEREFKTVDEEQTVLESLVRHTCKFAGVPIIKTNKHYVLDEKNAILSNLITDNFKISLNLKKIIISACVFICMVLIFISGIVTANSHWFNDVFYIKSRQMENLNIKSLKPYDKVLFNATYSQYDMNMASSTRYKHYHEYYEKVTDRIKNFDYGDDTIKSVITNYLNGYEKRKAEIEYLLFPYLNEPQTSSNNYGTMIGVVYPSAMLEFDRIELLTYRMLLTNMYASYLIPNLNAIFEE